MRPSAFLPQPLLSYLRQNFRLDWQGVHGASHWARVAWNGHFLARHIANVRLDVVTLFAFLHDHCRTQEASDPWHGSRAAQNAERLRGQYFELDDEGFALLSYAMIRHSDGDLIAPLTVQVCWDADRLDIGRVGGEPDSKRLCTAFAQRAETIATCHARALQHKIAMTI